MKPDPDNQETSRAFVAAGMCPICGSGPFAVVAIHAQMKHGVDRWALREMLGVYKTTSICDPAHSAAARRRGRRDWDKVADKMERARGQVHTRNLSTAAKARNRDQSEANRDDAVAAMQAGSAARHRAYREREIARFRELGSDWFAVQTMAQEEGRAVQQVRKTLKDAGVPVPDGRGQRWKVGIYANTGADTPPKG